VKKLPVVGSVDLQWVAQRNKPNKKGHWSKVAGIPVAYIGSSRREARATCEATGCPLLDTGGCYAWTGTPAMGFGAVCKGLDGGRRYSLRRALDESSRFIGPERLPLQAIRVAGLGDPWVIARKALQAMKREAIKDGVKWLIVYTHAWRDLGKHLKGLAMASCESLQDADQAVDQGWRATVILPWDAEQRPQRTPKGRKVSPCPAQLEKFEGLKTCNACGLCDASRDLVPVVGFFDHSPRARAARRRSEKGANNG
jgi:hypothetical protein